MVSDYGFMKNNYFSIYNLKQIFSARGIFTWKKTKATFLYQIIIFLPSYLCYITSELVLYNPLGRDFKVISISPKGNIYILEILPLSCFNIIDPNTFFCVVMFWDDFFLKMFCVYMYLSMFV